MNNEKQTKQKKGKKKKKREERETWASKVWQGVGSNKSVA